MGEPAKAIEWLEQAHQHGVRLSFSLRVALEWEPLRMMPSFNRLLKENRVTGS